MNTPADSNTRENANTNTDISITANATGFSTKTLNPQILVTLWNVERLWGVKMKRSPERLR